MSVPAPQVMSRAAADLRWDDVRRVEAWAGETRVNLIRLTALVVFYANHLVNYYLLREDPTLTPAFHNAVTAIVLAWSASAVLLYVSLARRWVPPALKYFATLWDTFLITALVALSGDPRSPLSVLYFLVIAAAPLRLSLALAYVATLAAIAGYLFLLGYYAFYLVGAQRYYADASVRIPRVTEAIWVLALGAAGLLAGQVVRQARRVAHGGAITVEPPSGR
jgi:hypothetical protein